MKIFKHRLKKHVKRHGRHYPLAVIIITAICIVVIPMIFVHGYVPMPVKEMFVIPKAPKRSIFEKIRDSDFWHHFMVSTREVRHKVDTVTHHTPAILEPTAWAIEVTSPVTDIDKEISLLREKGFPAYTVSIASNKKVIKIGPEVRKENAEADLKILQALGFKGKIIPFDPLEH